MNVIAMSIALGAAAVLQAVLPTAAWLGQVPVPVLLSLVVYYALSRSRPALIGAALAAGVLQDALGEVPLGCSSLCFCVVGLMLNRYREEIFPWEGVTHMVFGGAAAAAVAVATAVLLTMPGLLELSFGAVALKVVGALLLGMVATPFVCRATHRLDKWLGTLEPERA